MTIIELADLKTRLRISGTADDDLLTQIIEGVEMAIARSCGRVIGERSVLIDDGTDITEYFDGGGRVIQLAGFPVSEITSIKEALDRDWDAADALVVDEDYVLDASCGLIYSNAGVFLAGPQAVEVIYQGGLATAPADLIAAVLEQCAVEWGRLDKQAIVSTGGQGGNVSFVQPGGLTEGVRRLIEPFRRMVAI